MHVIAAKAVSFKEALTPEFKVYQEQIVKNAAALSQALLKRGFDLVSGGTDNHLVLLDVRNRNMTGKEAEHRLDEIGVTTNKNTIPFDPESPFVTSGLRVGTPAITTRGFNEADMDVIAEIFELTLAAEPNNERARELVDGLCAKYPLYR